MIPSPPKPPLCRIIQEGGSIAICNECGSSLRMRWWEFFIPEYFWAKGRGCIQPECENYYLKRDG